MDEGRGRRTKDEGRGTWDEGRGTKDVDEGRGSESFGIGYWNYALGAMEWLGLFDDKPMNRGTDSPFEVTSDLMLEKMMLGPQERDMIVLQHTFLVGYSDGRKEVIRSRMLTTASRVKIRPLRVRLHCRQR